MRKDDWRRIVLFESRSDRGELVKAIASPNSCVAESFGFEGRGPSKVMRSLEMQANQSERCFRSPRHSAFSYSKAAESSMAASQL